MREHLQPYDVFLSYSVVDAELARGVLSSFRAAGLQVCSMEERPTGKSIRKAIVGAIAESNALVVVLSPKSASSPGIAVEIGVAFGWNKPICAVTSDEDTAVGPYDFLGTRIYELSRIDDVIREIRNTRRPMSSGDHDALLVAYRSLGVATDQLLLQPVLIARLADAFRHKRHKSVPGERLVQELIRLRKQGKLAPLRRAG